MEKIFFDPKLEFYALPKDVAVPLTGNMDFSIEVTKDKDFWITRMNFYAGGAAAGDLSIKFNVAGRDNSFVNGSTKTDLLFGDGKQSFDLPVATRVPGGATISGNIANLGGTLRNVQICFIGYRCAPGYVPQQFVASVNAQVVRRGVTAIRR